MLQNDDKEIGDLLKVVMLADYSVSMAEVLMASTVDYDCQTPCVLLRLNDSPLPT